MKNTFNNKNHRFLISFFAGLSILTTLSFTSCGYQPVFYGIMHDVLPEEATISGNITTLARCSIDSKEYFVLSSGGSIKYKEVTSSQHGDWKSGNIKLPFSFHHYNYFDTSTESEGHKGQQVLRVISDENNIYLLTASFKQDNEYGVVLPNDFYLWTAPLNKLLGGSQSDWKNIAEEYKSMNLFNFGIDTSQSEVVTNFSFFFTNALKPQHRKAYLAVSSDDGLKYYELNGSQVPQDCTSTVTGSNLIKVNNDSTKVNSAFYIGDTLYFSDSLVTATNETSSKDATCVCLAGISSGNYSTSDLYFFKAGASEPEKLLSIGSPIASLAFTADSLLVGKGSFSSTYTSNGGISRILLDENGKPQNKTASFENNATYQFTSSYILMTLTCADPSKNEADACLYTTITYRGSSVSSSASFNDIGLWSYYPSRGNWNRE